MQPLSDAREGQPLRGFSENLELPDGDVPHDRGRVLGINSQGIPSHSGRYILFYFIMSELLTALDQWSH